MAQSLSAKRVVALDGIRGVAIVMVMALHFICSMSSSDDMASRVAAKLTSYGVWGVDLFFVLSGYLITGILFDAKGRQGYFRSFYMRRTLRIFPLYYAVLVVLIFLVPEGFAVRYAPGLDQLRDVQIWLWSYLTNFHLAETNAFSIPYVSHFWSLAVEEQFYLVWPFIIASLTRRAALTACALFSVAALLCRIGLGVGAATTPLSV